MTERILLIRHMPGERADRVAVNLARRGYELDQVWVAEGQALPSRADGYAGAVIYGGSQMVSQIEGIDYLKAEREWLSSWIAEDRPLLGICLGAQLIANTLGARVCPHPDGMTEIGYAEIAPTDAEGNPITEPMTVYHWHHEGFDLPDGAELLAEGQAFENQAFRFGANVYGLQFHPEVTKEMMAQWLENAKESLAKPGAQPPERHRSMAEIHFEPSGLWLETFLDHWLPGD
jgi:GMP synthase (glutamine-hydrolysing)